MRREEFTGRKFVRVVPIQLVLNLLLVHWKSRRYPIDHHAYRASVRLAPGHKTSERESERVGEELGETRVSSSCQEWRQVFLSRPHFSATPHRKHVPYELPLRETTLVLRAWRAPLKGARRRVVPAQKVAMMVSKSCFIFWW